MTSGETAHLLLLLKFYFLLSVFVMLLYIIYFCTYNNMIPSSLALTTLALTLYLQPSYASDPCVATTATILYYIRTYTVKHPSHYVYVTLSVVYIIVHTWPKYHRDTTCFIQGDLQHKRTRNFNKCFIIYTFKYFPSTVHDENKYYIILLCPFSVRRF